MTNRDFSTALGHALHRPSFMPTPPFALRVLLGEVAEVVTTGQRVLPQRALALGYSYKYPMVDAALTQIGIELPGGCDLQQSVEAGGWTGIIASRPDMDLIDGMTVHAGLDQVCTINVRMLGQTRQRVLDSIGDPLALQGNETR